MTKAKTQPKKASKKEPTIKPLKYETVEVDGESKTRITYPDGRIEYREL